MGSVSTVAYPSNFGPSTYVSVMSWDGANVIWDEQRALSSSTSDTLTLPLFQSREVLLGKDLIKQSPGAGERDYRQA